MTRIGIAGLGFMGMIHYHAYQKVSGAQVVALCEQDPVKLSGDWRGIKGNFGPPGTMMDLSGKKTYSKLSKLLADPEVDVVDICLPPGAHAKVAVAALKVGKHVFCEKPIALTVADARRMVKTSEATGKLLMIGHVLPFFPEFAFAHRAVRSGEYGRLLGCHLKRIISDPQWLRNYYEPAQVGGPMLDLHVHDAHFMRLLCGMPHTVFSTGRMRGEVAEFFTSQFLFDDSLLASAAGGVIQQQGRGFTHGYEIHLDGATLLYDFAVVDGKPELSMPVTVLTADGKMTRPTMESSDPVDAFVSELTEVVESVRAGRNSPVLGSDMACDALILCDRQTSSIRKRKPVKV